MANQTIRDETNKEKTLLCYTRKKKADKPTKRAGEKKRVAESTKLTCKRAKSTIQKQTETDNGHQSKEYQVEDKNEEQDTSDVEDTSTGLRKLDTRMSPSDFVTLLTELTPAQLKSLATTPFKYFVDLKVSRFPSKLAHYIVSTYNDRDHEIVLTNGQRFTVKKEDVHNVLGLPIGPTLMTGKPNVPTNQYETVFSEWINQFGKDAKGRVVKMGVLKQYIIEHKEEAGPMFKRNIILYIVTKMIFCAGNDHVWLDIFPWLVDTDNLNQLDWCDFVIDRLMKARENWSDGFSFCGPLLFLVLHYVDTVVDGKRDTTIRTYPRFIGWTTKELNNREKKSSKRGGFGGGYVEKDGPTSNEFSTINKYEEPIEEEPENDITAILNDYLKTMESLASLYRQFDIKGRKLFEKNVNHEDVKKVIMDSRKVFNLSVLPNACDTKQSILKASESVQVNEKAKADSDENTPTFSQDSFYDTPEIWAIVDSTIKAKQSLLQPDDIEPPSFSLGLTQDFLNTSAAPLDHETNETEEENGQEQPSFSLWLSDSASPLNPQTHEEEEENGQEAEVQEEGEGGPKDQRKQKTPINRENRLPGKEFRSPYLVRCLNPKSLPTKKEIEFAAYVLSLDKTPLTCMFKCGSVMTTNEDLRSLVTKDSFVLANVISTYAFILNFRERYKSQSSPSRAFFPIEVTTKLVGFDDYEKSYTTFKSDMDLYFKMWSIFENPSEVDLFFFPFYLERHFFVACFNVKNGKLRYDFLDNKSEGGSSLAKYSDLPSKLQEFFARWLFSENMFNKASLVRGLKITRPEMKWRDQSNDCDCAVYTMRHMETYQGDLKDWDTGLEKGQRKALQNLRVKYAYDIVNFEKNGLKTEVLSRASREKCT